jgi:hypothetical protein
MRDFVEKTTTRRRLLAGLGMVSAICGTSGIAFAQEGPPPATPPGEMAAMMTPPTSPISTPAIAGPLSYNVTPLTLNLGPLGEKVYVDGALTGLAFWQNNASRIGSDSASRLDLSNGQVFVQKTDGIFQYFIQAGIYSLPAVGAPYVNSHQTTSLTYGWVPQGFVKLAPTDNISVEIGKLPTLIGDEYTFTYENMNIFRGLLWNQEPAVQRGVQVNYTQGPLAFSLSLNDGYYSNRYNWITGSAAWTIDMANSVSLVGGGNLGHTDFATSATPFFQNNGSIFNLIYTHTDGALTVSPYFQYASVGADPAIGIPHDASTTGFAVLANYAFNDNFKLAGRVEYITASGKGVTLATSTNLLYGPGSNAFSFTITPTYQFGLFYLRGEYSYVSAGSTTAGLAFGPSGTATSQSRFALEGGILF